MRRYLIIVFLVITAAQAFGISSDLGEIGVGAKPLSLGKAYVGGASDASAVFLNPAGLADEPAVKFNSMAGKLLQDVSYVSFAGTYSLKKLGVIGIGYINAGTTDIPLTTLTSTATQDIINQYGSTDYSSSILYLSYARELLPNMLVGTNFKIFMQGFSQNSGALDGANGIGTDMDLGIMSKPRKELSIGAVAQNFLPTTMMGRFVWQKGNVEESIPLVLKAGLAANIVGREGFYRYRGQEVSLYLDSESRPRQDRPGLWHIGLDWGPTDYLSIRAGVDQKAKASDLGVGVDNNMTAGIGLRYKGFTFDYAYHQYGELTENTTHFFSMGYVGLEEQVVGIIKKYREEEEKLFIPKIKLKSGIKTFTDVTQGFWAKDPIEYLATLGIISGYADDTFRPDQAVTRAELATMLVKAKGFAVSTPEADVFEDVKADNWAAPYIKVAMQRKYISGYQDKSFKPWKKITRAESVVVLSKFDGLSEPLSISQSPFPDVSRRYWAARWIAVAKNAGLLEYLSGKNFEPEAALTRAEAAEMISKTEYAKQKIKELLIKGVTSSEAK
ncbi:MAG: S-layer homology domain-containing protein [Candidatus Margulisiibacteriota bacterium]